MTAYSTCAFGMLAAGAARSVYADAREMGLGIGHELAKLEDLTGDAYLIRLNGAELHRSSSHTDQSPSEVLQRYESYCRESPSLLGRAMRDIPATLSDRAVLPSESPLRVAVVRDEKEDRGMVACFVEDPDVSAEALGASLVAFADTGDLSKLGRCRYACAERSTSARGGTHVVTDGSDGGLNVGNRFAPAGDAPARAIRHVLPTGARQAARVVLHAHAIAGLAR